MTQDGQLTDEGSVPEMRIWSMFLIKSDLKWCIHLSRSLLLYCNDRQLNICVVYRQKPSDLH